jgi:hypothetical protein
MKLVRSLGLLVPLLALPALALRAQVNLGAGIVGSSHDFSSTGPWAGATGPGYGKQSATTQLCIFCHTPHQARTNRVPLWNRSLDTVSAITMYSSATMQNAVAARPGDISMACLSCHDGVGAISNYGTNTGKTDVIGAGIFRIGTNLSVDHPVGVTIVDNADPAIKTMATFSATLPLFGSGKNMMECATCHEPHNRGLAGGMRFLRASTTASAICTACHTK